MRATSGSTSTGSADVSSVDQPWKTKLTRYTAVLVSMGKWYCIPATGLAVSHWFRCFPMSKTDRLHWRVGCAQSGHVLYVLKFVSSIQTIDICTIPWQWTWWVRRSRLVLWLLSDLSGVSLLWKGVSVSVEVWLRFSQMSFGYIKCRLDGRRRPCCTGREFSPRRASCCAQIHAWICRPWRPWLTLGQQRQVNLSILPTRPKIYCLLSRRRDIYFHHPPFAFLQIKDNLQKYRCYD